MCVFFYLPTVVNVCRVCVPVGSSRLGCVHEAHEDDGEELNDEERSNDCATAAGADHMQGASWAVSGVSRKRPEGHARRQDVHCRLSVGLQIETFCETCERLDGKIALYGFARPKMQNC